VEGRVTDGHLGAVLRPRCNLHFVWKKLGLPEAIATAAKREPGTYDPAPVVFRMVVGCLLNPSSKASTQR